MTERGLPGDGAPACPFVAFGDDREGRSTSPDDRHRCFAESPPAPRALAHQEAYCLSSAFPVCPTFQDWARREAAHARGAGKRAETAPTAAPMAAAGLGGVAAGLGGVAAAADASASDLATAADAPAGDLQAGDNLRGETGPSDLPIRRNPPRDWAAPPPWAGGAGSAGGPLRAPGAPDTSDLLAGRSIEGHGLAGSAADRLAGGPPPSPPARDPSTGPDVALPALAAEAGAAEAASASGSPSAGPDDELAGLVQRRPPPLPDFDPLPARSARRQAVSATKSGAAIPGPSWERLQRAEAYPAIRSRSGMPGLPRVAVLAGALAIAALALFMLPALLGVGGSKPSGSASPTASSVVATATPELTTVPAPSQQIYIIKNKDTLSKVARMFGITLAELLAANPTIKNPDKISLGQQIIIPLSGGVASPSASP